MLNGHGNDLHNFKTEIKADFSSNVWFEGPPEPLIAHINKKVNAIANYPEPDAASHAHKIESFYRLPQNSCIVTNGSIEGFYLVAQAINKRSATVITPSFAEYEDACRRFNYKYQLLSNKESDETLTFKSDLVWLGNPNNPDGKVTSISTIEKWLMNNPQTIFIIDEAYADLCTSFESAIPLLKKFRNLIVIKSFTKTFAIPGLRLGFILTNSKIIQQLKPFQLPWSVNALALEACSYIIDNHESLLVDKSKIKKISETLQINLNALGEFKVTPSACNYFLVKTQTVNAHELKMQLANEYGILIRDASNFHGLTKQHFRIAIQSPEKNNMLISALKQWSKL